MRTFILYSRKGVTEEWKGDAIDAGRMDVVSDCIRSAFLLSHDLRDDVVFYVCLNGPPNPPKCLKVNKGDVEIDAVKMNNKLKKLIKNAEKKSFQELIKELKGDFIVLNERGEIGVPQSENPIFVLGDNIGLPKNEEKFVERFKAKKLGLGKKHYFAKDALTIVNFLCDQK